LVNKENLLIGEEDETRIDADDDKLMSKRGPAEIIESALPLVESPVPN